MKPWFSCKRTLCILYIVGTAVTLKNIWFFPSSFSFANKYYDILNMIQNNVYFLNCTFSSHNKYTLLIRSLNLQEVVLITYEAMHLAHVFEALFFVSPLPVLSYCRHCMVPSCSCAPISLTLLSHQFEFWSWLNLRPMSHSWSTRWTDKGPHNLGCICYHHNGPLLQTVLLASINFYEYGPGHDLRFISNKDQLFINGVCIVWGAKLVNLCGSKVNHPILALP